MNLALTQASLLDRRLQNVITPLCGPVWVFERGGFSPSGAEIYIRGVLLALHQRVKPAKCCKQFQGESRKPFPRRCRAAPRNNGSSRAGMGMRLALGDVPH
ncbi:doublecortin domain-containing protein 1-like isoform X3 [Passer domesticus]|uniref:doublecortin domain-containing protein 1-like isoform X3 n=1 Tax=Passer domesticus TaxID=48849 RepID=UPI0030FF23D3